MKSRLCKCAEHYGVPWYHHHKKILLAQLSLQLWVTVTSETANSMAVSVDKDAKPEGRLSSEKWGSRATNIFRHVKL